MSKPKAISLFCGAGGCSLGFKNAGYDILYANDNDPEAINSYKSNFPNTTVEKKGIQEIDFSKKLRQLGLSKGELDIIIGGPPCQGFSTAGSRFWDDPRNYLLREYVRSLSEIKPKWFLMENVEGLLTLKKGEYLEHACNAFINLGYNIRIDKIYSQEYGIPQRRKRVFIIGSRVCGDFSWPKPLYPANGRIYKNTPITLRNAFVNLPKPTIKKNLKVRYEIKSNSELFEYYKTDTGETSEHYFKELSEIQLKRISNLDEGQTMKDLPNELQHKSFKKRAERRVMDGTPSHKRGGAPSGLKRLYFDEPSLTITSASIREFIHPKENRPLTVRECARIQTFPDYFEFSGSESQKIKQIGNAIPPILAKIIAEEIKERLDESCLNTEETGKVIDFNLTKSKMMSPALERTYNLLLDLKRNGKIEQLKLF